MRVLAALVAACTRDLAEAGQVEVVDRDRVAADFRDLGLSLDFGGRMRSPKDPAALPFLQAALAAAPDSGMFRQAVAECEHAMQLRSQ
jgi:hypothetical protein